MELLGFRFTMPDKQQFREYYAGLPDDQFQMVALRPDLVPEAREAVTEELQARGLTKADLKTFRRQMKRDMALAKRSEGLARERWRDTKWRVHLAFLIFVAWFGAAMLPTILLQAPPRQWDGVAVVALLVVGVGLMGLWAWKKGKRVMFVLSTVVPLALLAISTLVVLLVLS